MGKMSGDKGKDHLISAHPQSATRWMGDSDLDAH